MDILMSSNFRSMVYHVEAVQTGSGTDELFQTMERKLLRMIMDPAMIATWVFGLLLAMTPGMSRNLARLSQVLKVVYPMCIT